MLGRTDSRRRLLFLLVVFAIGSTLLTARLGVLAGHRPRTAGRPGRSPDDGHPRLAEQARRHLRPDRDGRAGHDGPARTAGRGTRPADPGARAGRPSSSWPGSSPSTRPRAAALRDRMTRQRTYVILRHGLDRTTADRIRAAIDAKRVFGLSLEPEPERVYPQVGGGPGSTLAAHLIGFVNREGGGQYGVEQYYQATLAGEPRIVVAQRDASGLPMLEDAVVSQAGAPGTDLRLTIDAGLQLKVEQELLAAWVADRAKRASAVVMDPYTGEIYAMATYPSYDGNDYKAIAATDAGRFIDPTISTVYEPGSVFKMMTAAAALTNGTVTPSTRIKDVGTLHLDKGRTKIDDADRKGMGWMTFEDGVAYSRNVVAAKVALGLGKTTRESSAILYDMWLRLGYGAADRDRPRRGGRRASSATRR